MDSNFHKTVMQRPQEDKEAGSLPRPDEQRGHVASHNSPYAARSPPGARSHSSYTTPIQPYSPPNGLPRRPSFSNQYQPSAPAQLPLPANLHGATSQASPLGPPSTAPIYQSSDYTPAPRDKPASNYYDPTSDSSAVKPSGQNNEANQVGPSTQQGTNPNFFVIPLTKYRAEPRAVQQLILCIGRIKRIRERRIFACERKRWWSTFAHILTFTSEQARLQRPACYHAFSDGIIDGKTEQWCYGY